MSTQITTVASVGGVNEQDAIMSNSTFARPITLPSTWNHVRVGARLWASDFGSGPTGTPLLQMGLCSGTTNLVGDANCQYFVGVTYNSSVWSYSPGGNGVYFSIALAAMTKTGSVTTLGSNVTADSRLSMTGSNAAFLFVDITKGSPNYTIGTFYYSGVGATATSTNFQNQLFLSSPTQPAHTVSSNTTIAVNEALSGSLNTATIYWNRTDFNLYVKDWGVAVIS